MSGFPFNLIINELLIELSSDRRPQLEDVVIVRIINLLRCPNYSDCMFRHVKSRKINRKSFLESWRKRPSVNVHVAGAHRDESTECDGTPRAEHCERITRAVCMELLVLDSRKGNEKTALRAETQIKGIRGGRQSQRARAGPPALSPFIKFPDDLFLPAFMIVERRGRARV